MSEIEQPELQINNVKVNRVNDPAEIPIKKPTFLSISNKEFHKVRNLLVTALRLHGTVGPLGEAFIDCNSNEEFEFNGVVESKHDFFVLDDQLWKKTRYQKVEVEGKDEINSSLVETIRLVLFSYPDWGVILQSDTAYIYIEVNKIYIVGEVEKLKYEKDN